MSERGGLFKRFGALRTGKSAAEAETDGLSRRRLRTIGPWVAGALAVVLVAVGAALVLRNSDDPDPDPATSGVPGSTGCGQVIREPLDPRSAVHVLPGARPPRYSTDPPTSGPHEPGMLSQSVFDEPVPKQVQVGSLEAGQVVVQYRDLSPAEVTEIKTAAGPLVVVAPNPSLPSRVVLTAWMSKLRCSTLAMGAVNTFAQVFSGKPVGDQLTR